MSGPTTRVLALLELLQARGRLSGAEIAEQLDVDRRTVRRYISVLEELGIPVTTEQGRYGGYMLVPGFKLPPLMFTEAEAQVITLALLAMREHDLLEDDVALASVQAKLERVMPTHLKAQVQAIGTTTQLIRPNQASNHRQLLDLTQATQARQNVSMTYQSPQGDRMQRQLNPYGLVFRAGYWYVSGYCHLRQALRSFRLDRLSGITLLDRVFERPANFNAARHLQDSLSCARRRYPVSVLLHTDIGKVTACMSDMEAMLDRQDNGTLLTTSTDSYCWFAWWLTQLPFEFTIQSPDALKDALKEHIQRLLRAL
ncbi:helix-turn-helix transcriptional regulator [Marinimicrobium alkaliphilum]|uniref:helix-turn-helix transcriptional regulator n=1 Tax=Marinimicrobium alkaliphilum TaxID=2202654 RepID=UPI000DBAB9E7|nr:YafY family protein [Marinimicrobium alkaliphilum]